MSPRQLLRSACRLALPLVALLAFVVQPPTLAGAASPNLVRNPGCETSVDGWWGWQGTVARNTLFARLTRTPSRDPMYQLDTSERPLSVTEESR